MISDSDDCGSVFPWFLSSSSMGQLNVFSNGSYCNFRIASIVFEIFPSIFHFGFDNWPLG
jgi:hypothetical protein